MQKLTEKQKRFCDYYIETGNATEAARRAGYKGKNMDVISSQNLGKLGIKSYIDKKIKSKDIERIASQDEVLEYFTKVMRGETLSEVIVVEALGDGSSKAIRLDKKPDEKEKLTAARELARRYGLYKETELKERQVALQEKQAQEVDGDIEYEIEED